MQCSYWKFWNFDSSLFFHKDDGSGESDRWMFVDLLMLVATLGHTLWNASCWGVERACPLWWEDPPSKCSGLLLGVGQGRAPQGWSEVGAGWGLDRHHKRTELKALLLSLRTWTVMMTLSISPGFTKIRNNLCKSMFHIGKSYAMERYWKCSTF